MSKEQIVNTELHVHHMLPRSFEMKEWETKDYLQRFPFSRRLRGFRLTKPSLTDNR